MNEMLVVTKVDTILSAQRRNKPKPKMPKFYKLLNYNAYDYPNENITICSIFSPNPHTLVIANTKYPKMFTMVHTLNILGNSFSSYNEVLKGINTVSTPIP